MRLIIFTLFAIIGTTIGLQLPAQLNSTVQFISRDDLAQLMQNNPDAVFTPLEIKQTKQQIQYTLGNRVSGDRLVGQTSNSHSWASSQDIQITLEYPTSGQGAVITFLIATLQQSSNLGQGYVVSGGIGTRYIKVVIEARSTTYLNYLAQVYGI